MRQYARHREPAGPRTAGGGAFAAPGHRLSAPAAEAGSRRFEVGAASDPLEREADRVADAVIGPPSAAAGEGGFGIGRDAGPAIRRALDSPFSISEGLIVEPEEGEEKEEPVQAQASTGEMEEDEEEEPVQAKQAGAGGVAGASAAAKIGRALGGPGRPLPPAVRTGFESRFGHDFSRVRVHAGPAADEAARSVGARAFTRDRHLVFASGQYAPDSRAGRWLLAHELTHVVQQGAAAARDGAGGGPDPASPPIRRDAGQAIRRVNWGSAVDTGRDSYPWPGLSYRGDVMQVQTDAGTSINAWRPHDGVTYWCHGFTFGGSSASGGPYSLWGSDVPTVLSDDGWQGAQSCLTRKNDILVFWNGPSLTHSGIVKKAVAPNAIIDDTASTLDSKWGPGPQQVTSWETAATSGYGRYKVYSKEPLAGPCAGKGANEI